MNPPSKLSKRVERELHQTKVVVRRLPPDFTEDKFREAIGALSQTNYFYFSPGDSTLGPFGCSRAYINFEDENGIIQFRDEFDGCYLTSEKGQKYQAVVEFAPFQPTPKKGKRKPDTRCGTIEQDADYQAFLKEFESKPETLPSIELNSYVERLEASKAAGVQKTPLIDYLEVKYTAKSAKSRKNKVYVAETKKRKRGIGGEGRPKSSKERKGLTDWEVARGSNQDGRKGSGDDRAKQYSYKRDEQESSSKTAAREEKGRVGNHMGGDESKPRGDRRGGRFREGSTGEEGDRRKGDSKDERKVAMGDGRRVATGDGRRVATGEGRRGNSQFENGEVGAQDDRPRSRYRPDRQLYTPGRGRGRGEVVEREGGGGERGGGGGRGGEEADYKGPGKPREVRGGRSERDSGQSKREYSSSKYDYGYKKRERGGGSRSEPGPLEQDGDHDRSQGGQRYQQHDDYGGKRRDRDWSKKPRGGGGGRERYDDRGSYDRSSRDK